LPKKLCCSGASRIVAIDAGGNREAPDERGVQMRTA